MATGSQYLNAKSKRLVGTDDFGSRLLGYMQGKIEETNTETYDSATFHRGGVSLVADGNDQFRLDKANTNVRGSDGVGHFVNPDWNSWDWFRNLYFQNENAIDYYVALKYCAMPQAIQINPRTGAPEYVSYEERVGEIGDPDSVVDNTTDITFVVDGVLESGCDCSGRRVWVYMVNPAVGAITEVIAIEECVVAYSGGQNKITTSALLGQTTVSTTSAHYQVVALGPTVKRYTDLRSVDEYTFVGIVTGAGAGNPPTVFDTADQRVVPYSWITALVDGLPQDFIPAVDNTYDLGSPSRRWANIYTQNLSVAGDFLPVTDDSADLGSPSKRWQDLFLSGDAIIHDVLPEADDAYDLGSAGYKWKNVHVEGYVNTKNFTLGALGGEGIQTDFVPGSDNAHDLGNTGYRWNEAYVNILHPRTPGIGGNIGNSIAPTADNTYDLGTAGLQWRNLYIDGTAYVDELSVSDTALEGVASHLVPNADDTRDLGNSSYGWKDIYCVGTGRIELLLLGTGLTGNVDSVLIPTSDGFQNLGHFNYQWSDLYVERIFESTAPYLWAHQTGGDIVISHNTWGIITPDTDILHSGLTVESGSGLLTADTGHEGFYKVDYVCIVKCSITGQDLQLQIKRNGTKVVPSLVTTRMIGTEYNTISYSFLANLSATTDYIEIEAYFFQLGHTITIKDDSHLTAVRCKKVKV